MLFAMEFIPSVRPLEKRYNYLTCKAKWSDAPFSGNLKNARGSPRSYEAQRLFLAEQTIVYNYRLATT